MTNKTLLPRKIKAILLGVLAHVIGWKILLYLIAKGEYSAYTVKDSQFEVYNKLK